MAGPCSVESETQVVQTAIAIKEAGQFCVNILASDQTPLCGIMASRADDKFEGVDWTPAPVTNAPVLPGVLAVIDCLVDEVVVLGDHDLLVGRVQHLEVLAEGDVDPMVFFKGQYGGFGA